MHDYAHAGVHKKSRRIAPAPESIKVKCLLGLLSDFGGVVQAVRTFKLNWFQLQCRDCSFDVFGLIEQSVDPGTKRIALGLGGVIFALAIVFVVLNVQGQIADQQKYLNVGLWFVGSIAGGVGALMFGLTAAEPKSPVKTLKTSN